MTVEQWWNGDWKRKTKGTAITACFWAPSSYALLTRSRNVLHSGLRREKLQSDHLRYGRAYDRIMKIIYIASE
jgi:hypothetical protein